MKKIAIVLAVLLVLTASVSADIIKIGITADYTMVSMADINNALNKENTLAGGSLTKFGSGVAGSVDVGFPLIPFLLVGPRAGVVYCFPAEEKESFPLMDIHGNPIGEYKTDTTFNAVLVPLEIGAQLNIGLPGLPVSISGAVYGGYGLAFLNLSDKILQPDTGSVINDVPYNGGGFMGEAVLAVNVDLFPFMKWNINAGYRLANITNLTASSNSIIGGTVVKSGDAFKPNGSGAGLDFSGLNVGLGISLGF